MWDKVYDSNHIMKMRIQAAKQVGLGLHLNALSTELKNTLAIHQWLSDFQLKFLYNESLGSTLTSCMDNPDFQNYLVESRLNCNEQHRHVVHRFEGNRSNLMLMSPCHSGSVATREDTESYDSLLPLDSSDFDTDDVFLPRSQLSLTATSNGNNNDFISILVSSGSDSEKPNGNNDNKFQHYPKKKPNDKKWLESFKQLVAYKNENGDCVVPRGYSSNPKLACWVAEQRKLYKLHTDGKYSPITPNRMQLLEDIGFAWNAHEAAWHKNFNDLKAYKDENGDTLVPLMHPKYPKLGLWVKEQRLYFTLLNEGKESHMTQDRLQKLDSVGFCWDTNQSTWNERFRDFLKFQEEYGHCAVPINYPPNPKLGTWVHQQRRQYKVYRNGSPCQLTPERIKCLESVGFLWHARKRDCTKFESQQSLRGENLTIDGESSGKRQRLGV